MSWFFTDILVLQLTHVVIYKKFYSNDYIIHKIFWPINILLQILPFSTKTYYGNHSYLPYGVTVCSYYNNNRDYRSEAMWLNITVNYMLNISFITISFCSIFIVGYTRYIRANNPLITTVIDNEVWSTIILYPLGQLFAWLPSTIYSVIFERQTSASGHFPNNGWILINVFDTLNPLYGLILSSVFYLKTEEAREEWISIIHRLLGADINSQNTVSNTTPRISVENEINVIRIGTTSLSHVGIKGKILKQATFLDDRV